MTLFYFISMSELTACASKKIDHFIHLLCFPLQLLTESCIFPDLLGYQTLTLVEKSH